MEITYRKFVKDVADRAGISNFDAEYAVAAFLQTLGERVPAHVARDLASCLDPDLARELLRNIGEPQPYSAEEFLEIFSQRHGIPANRSRDQAKAIWEVLRRTVGMDALDEICASLSEDYEAILGVMTGP